MQRDLRGIDAAIVGAGAAGLMAAIAAGRSLRAAAHPARIVVLDGAPRIGAKILVSGGGRCNVTHDEVDERAFAGSTPNAIRKVLRRLGVPETVAFFRGLGVDLVREEETGKLFPSTNAARDVLEALLTGARAVGVEIVHPWRVEAIACGRAEGAGAGERAAGDGGGFGDGAAGDGGGFGDGAAGFVIEGPAGVASARRVILATGGRSLPKSGSDGAGYSIARALGHTLTPRILPALVALTLEPSCFLRGLAGLSARVTLAVRGASGARLIDTTGSLLCTHFGISGPVVLDVSRHLLHARLDDPGARLVVSWIPGETAASADRDLLLRSGVSAGRWLRERGLPERLAAALCAEAGIDASERLASLSRERRRALAAIATELVLPVTGDRGFTHAEVTAGGVPLHEIVLETMESRLRSGLYLTGEICDVDGRIGGYNFQWAWASGHVAGTALARAILESRAAAPL